jgi:hypothetical protein
MATDFSSALRAEIAELEAALEADLRFRRLTELRRILDLYPTEPHEHVASGWARAELVNKFAFALSPRQTATGRKMSPERAKALEVAKLFLANRSGPTPTRDIYDHLLSLGLSIPGEVPVNNLSAMLSNSDEFFSHGRSGWSIRGPDTPISMAVMRDTVEVVLADMGTDEIREAYTSVKRHQGVPADVDGRLLATARSAIRRDLTDPEKRDLRAVFSEMAESSLTPADRTLIAGGSLEE